MKKLTQRMAALAVVAMGFAAHQANADEYYSTARDQNYQFACKGTSPEGHSLAVYGTINETRGTLTGDGVTVVVNNGIFGTFYQPATTLFINGPHLTTLHLRGNTNDSDSFTLRYSGEGAAINYLEMARNNITVSTEVVSCTTSASPF